MKKKILSFIMAFVMVVTLLPAGMVQAEETETEESSEVEEAKGLVDQILNAAPTVDACTNNVLAAQAENIIELGRLLDLLPTSEKLELDTYISEKTSSSYSTIQTFYTAYKQVLDPYIAEKAKELTDQIKALMAQPLTRDAFETLEARYDGTASYILDAVKSTDEGRSFEELQDLMEDADSAGDAISRIPNMVEEKDYVTFARRMEAAQTAVEHYYSEHATLRENEKFINCLLRDRRDELIPNVSTYRENKLRYDVEKNFHDIIDIGYEIMDGEVRELFRALVQALQAAEESEFEIARNSFYNYDIASSDEDIKTFVKWYDNIVKLEDRLDTLPVVPDDMISLAAALDVYDFYINDLTEKEQAMVPQEYLVKMDNAVRLSTNSDAVVAAIDEIGVVTSEEDFSDFVIRFENARDTYQTFLNQYREVDGVVTLVTNREMLNTASTVQELIKAIRRLEAEPDASMCAQLAQMMSIQLAYEDMTAEQREQIFNINVFNQIYEDTQEAQAVATKMDRVRTNFSVEDESLIQSIRQEYDELNDKAKAYVGSARYTAFQLVEQQLETLNKNVADQTIRLIQKIGTVTALSKFTIAAARASYDALTPTQKALVTNYQTLTVAEQDYRALNTTVASATVTGVRNYTYTGKAFKPVVTVSLNGITLTQEIDYTVSYGSNINAGTARLRITGIGYYSGTLTKTFKITAKKIAKAKVTGIKAKYTRTGKKIKPVPTVKLGSTKLKKGTDYKIKYSSNKKVGTASYVITGKGNYKGTIKGKFRIVKKSKKK